MLTIMEKMFLSWMYLQLFLNLLETECRQGGAGGDECQW